MEKFTNTTNTKNIDAPNTSGFFLAQNLRALRSQLELTQTQAAKAIGISSAVMNKAESGKYIPQSSTLYKMAQFFQIDQKQLTSTTIEKEEFEMLVKYQRTQISVRTALEASLTLQGVCEKHKSCTDCELFEAETKGCAVSIGTPASWDLTDRPRQYKVE